ncbi:MAG TPA: PIN domain-containing protein, partial [Rhizomicrobium sp.]
LIEFVSVAIRKSRLTVERTGTLVRGWLASFTLLTPGATLVEDTLDLLARYNLSAWDARLLAVCGRHSCKTLLSEDLQDGANYNGVRVINPFLDKNMRLLSEVLVS